MSKTSITNIAKWFLLSGIALLQNSCYFDAGSDQITGDYIVLWTDQHANQTVSKEYSPTSASVIVPEYVFAVGHNEDFIIVKQHPTNGFEGGYKVDTAVTNYYIIDMKGKFIKNEKGLIGPLTKEEFNAKLIELDIIGVPFDQTYSDDPNNWE